jgi:alkylhydroperoxidase family enzyme
LARRLGANDEQIATLARGEQDDFPSAWNAAFRLAEEMTRGGGRVSQPTYDALQREWTAGQIVEITAVIALFNYFNRIANALEIPPTK